MKLFKNRKQSEAMPDEVAERIATFIIALQQKAAHHLNQWAAKCPSKFRLYGFILFCLLFGGYCLYLLLIAIN